jgi:hypothetical protein
MRSWKSRRLVLRADEGENSSGELTITEKLDPRQVVTFEELLRAMMMEQDATRRVLVRKGLLTNEEVLEEIKTVKREMEGKKGR